MNANDPRLTAYALDELEPRERAQIEQLLRENPQAAGEVASLQSLCALLGTTLRVEKSEPLSVDHREAVLRAAGMRSKAAGNVVEGPSWWRSWQFAATAAACMVFGFGAYAIFDALTEPRPNYAAAQARTDGVEIGVPSAESAQHHPHGVVENAPELQLPTGSVPTPGVPSQSIGKVQIASANIGAQLQPQSPLPELAVTPDPAPLISAAPMTPAHSTVRRGSKEPMVGFFRPEPLVRKQTTGPSYDSKTLNAAEHPVCAVPLSFGPSNYAELVRIWRNGKLPSKELVDIHALVNAFPYQYAQPVGADHPVALHVEVGPHPLVPQYRLLQIAIQARAGGGEVVARNASVQVEFNAQRIWSYAFLGSNNGVSKEVGTDIRAGQGITAMCVLIPSGSDLKEQMFKVKLRYSSVGSNREREIEEIVSKSEPAFEKCSPEFRWASFVTCVGWFLSGTGEVNAKTLGKFTGLVGNALRFDPDGKRLEFVGLIRNLKDVADANSGGK